MAHAAVSLGAPSSGADSSRFVPEPERDPVPPRSTAQLYWISLIVAGAVAVLVGYYTNVCSGGVRGDVSLWTHAHLTVHAAP